ncbi:N-acetyllactosaminide beta-1,3-N-acetylglucosaminyltransferase 2a [Syngnathus typhle]
MFPNVPLYLSAGEASESPPGVLVQTPAWLRGLQVGPALKAAARAQVRSCCVPAAMPKLLQLLFLLLLLLNALACSILATLSWKPGRDHGALFKPRTRASFWNREQRRLDLSGPRPDSCRADRRAVTQVWDYNTLPRSLQDFLLYMHCRKSDVVIAPSLGCRRADPFLLLAVKSLVPHFGRRQAIRQTWGRAGVHANRTVAIVFLLGRTPPEDHHPNLQGMLGREAELHGDLLQWEFRETALNLSLKEALFLQWFRRNCPRARFVLEAHDDTFVNTFRVLDFLESLPRTGRDFLFVSDVVLNGRPAADRALPDFVPPSVFTGTYPPRVASGGFLLSGALALRLHDVSRRVLLFPVHEVYEGLCLRKLGLIPQKHPGFAARKVHRNGEGKDGEDACAHTKSMVVNGRTAQEMLRMWKTCAWTERSNAKE